MKKVFVILIVLVIIGAGIAFVVQQNKNEARKKSIDDLMDKWAGLAKKKKGEINRDQVRPELDKLTEEDIKILSETTDKIAAAKGVMDYLGIKDDIVKSYSILKDKTKILDVVQGIVFPDMK